MAKTPEAMNSTFVDTKLKAAGLVRPWKIHDSFSVGKPDSEYIRRDGNEAFKKDEKGKTITEDESKRGQEKMQKLVDKYTKLVDQAREAKEKEILEG